MANALPANVLARIFEHFSPSNDSHLLLAVLRRVNRAWRRILESDGVCRRLLGPCLGDGDWRKALGAAPNSPAAFWCSGQGQPPAGNSDSNDDDDDGDAQDVWQILEAIGDSVVASPRWLWRCGKVGATRGGHAEACCPPGHWFELLRDVAFASHLHRALGVLGLPARAFDPEYATVFTPLLLANNDGESMRKLFFEENGQFTPAIFESAVNNIYHRRLPIRLTHLSGSDLNRHITANRQSMRTPDRSVFSPSAHDDGVSLADINGDGVRALQMLFNYCKAGGRVDPPLCVVEVPPATGRLRKRDGTERDAEEEEVEFLGLVRDVYLLSVSAKSGRLVGVFGRALML